MKSQPRGVRTIVIGDLAPILICAVTDGLSTSLIFVKGWGENERSSKGYVSEHVGLVADYNINVQRPLAGSAQ